MGNASSFRIVRLLLDHLASPCREVMTLRLHVMARFSAWNRSSIWPMHWCIPASGSRYRWAFLRPGMEREASSNAVSSLLTEPRQSKMLSPALWPWPKISSVLHQRSGPFCRLRINSSGVWLFYDEQGRCWLYSCRQQSILSWASSGTGTSAHSDIHREGYH